MDDYSSWFDGGDSDYSDSGFDWDSWGSGNDLGDYGGDYGSNASDYNTSDPASNYQWASDNNSYDSLGYDGGSTAGSGYNWGGLVGPAMQGAGSWLSAVAQGKMSKEQLEFAEQMQEKAYAAKLAEDEKYYQSHGKQLSDAFQKYKGYYVNPNDSANQNKRETNIFGLLTPHPTTGPLANGW